jgi:hypothetical protein
VKRALALVVASLALTATAGAAEAAPIEVEQKSVAGFFRGQGVRYLDLGPVRLLPGNRVAPIWAFTNGTKRQRNVIDTVPGRADYTPLWRVTMVTWKAGVRPRTLRSAAAVRAAVRAGHVRLRRTSTVVNCPVLGFGQKKVIGFYRGNEVAYLDLGPVRLRAGNQTAPIWAFANGAEGQANVIDVVPGDEGYSPLWTVEMVTWTVGVAPRVLRSREEIEEAAAAGEVTIQKSSIVVNCPVV